MCDKEPVAVERAKAFVAAYNAAFRNALAETGHDSLAHEAALAAARHATAAYSNISYTGTSS